MAEGVPGPYQHAKFYRCIWAYCPQIIKLVIISWYKFLPKRNSWGCIKTCIHVHNYKPSPYAKEPWLFWKLYCLIAFLFSQRVNSKSMTKKSHLFVYSRCSLHDPHKTRHSDKDCPTHLLHPAITFPDPISSFVVANLLGLLNTLWEMPPLRVNAHWVNEILECCLVGRPIGNYHHRAAKWNL